ncbi:MAG: rhomboid family intramembrane serine protease [Myxococcales bacterium]|nr:rhomboid family intramembrane serine protease [Myxococcales bacterium]
MFRFPPLTPLLKQTLIGLLVTFVGLAILEVWVEVRVFGLLALYPARPGVHTLWQLFTFPFVYPPGPNSVLGFLIQLLFLWLILAPFELRFGPKRTVQLCLGASIAGGAVAVFVGLFLPIDVPVYGTNPWLLAGITALAMTLPKDATLSFFGVIPMKRDHLIYLILGLSVLSFLLSKNWISLVVDLTSVAVGALFIPWSRRPQGKRPRPKKPSAKGTGGLRVIQGGNDDDDDRPKYLN